MAGAVTSRRSGTSCSIRSPTSIASMPQATSTTPITKRFESDYVRRAAQSLRALEELDGRAEAADEPGSQPRTLAGGAFRRYLGRRRVRLVLGDAGRGVLLAGARSFRRTSRRGAPSWTERDRHDHAQPGRRRQPGSPAGRARRQRRASPRPRSPSTRRCSPRCQTSRSPSPTTGG